ncbi:tetratricopeptide repeat protein 30A-like [Paramacrobiotus metropolitanus]|uniref:tetratricopeptide repeat protein 30A-like n=1 Tax=Paramacrobiotus metropolitanus TaxID=2943436 RepID=UPI0024463195|nr:tetratricopeptide repeat protein 30A-like [Paramacrobiotus metropolitanus]XP_055336219.1 tetratricopeptide repeat protein 30A-like [Paramacrobiotus metropolitanus]XP_055336220.1 tetratricopeptide repeat protein 30A-like [Paramacrobiotus metropolitanus]
MSLSDKASRASEKSNLTWTRTEPLFQLSPNSPSDTSFGGKNEVSAFESDFIESISDRLQRVYGLPYGKVTKKVYELILRKQYEKVISILNEICCFDDRTFSAGKFCALLGFCYYQTKNYRSASECYGRLWNNDQQNPSHGLWLAHCYVLCDRFQEALHVLDSITSDNLLAEIRVLRAAIFVKLQQLDDATDLFNEYGEEKSNDFNFGILLYNKQKFHQARVVFDNVELTQGSTADCQYAQALCSFKLQDYATAQELCSELREALDVPHAPLEVSSNRLICSNQESSMPAKFCAGIATLLSGCYLQVNQRRSASSYLISISTNGGSSEAEFYCKASQTYIAAASGDSDFHTLEALVQSENHAGCAVHRNLLLLYLENNKRVEARNLIESFGDQLRCEFDQEYEWPIVQAVLLGLENPLASSSVSLDMQTSIAKDIAYYQEELRNLQSMQQQDGDSPSDTGKYEKKLQKAEQALRTIQLYIAKLYYDHKNYSQAIHVLPRDTNVDNIDTTTAMAHCLFMDGRYEDAVVIYDSLIAHFRNAYFTLISTPVDIVSHYCASQLFSIEDVAKIKEIIGEIIRSEKVNFEDMESEYREIAAARSHLIATCLNLAVTFLENGNYGEALQKAEEVLRLQPWHKDFTVWDMLKKVIVLIARNVISESSRGDGLIWNAIVSHLYALEEQVQSSGVEDDEHSNIKRNEMLPMLKLQKEVRDVRLVCQTVICEFAGVNSQSSSDRKHKRNFSRDLFTDLTRIVTTFGHQKS